MNLEIHAPGGWRTSEILQPSIGSSPHFTYQRMPPEQVRRLRRGSTRYRRRNLSLVIEYVFQDGKPRQPGLNQPPCRKTFDLMVCAATIR